MKTEYERLSKDIVLKKLVSEISLSKLKNEIDELDSDIQKTENEKIEETGTAKELIKEKNKELGEEIAYFETKKEEKQKLYDTISKLAYPGVVK